MKVISWIKSNKVTTGIIIWLILGLVAFIVYCITYKGVNWGVLTGVATWVLSAGVFFAFSQVQQARKSTNAQIALGLFQELRSDKALKIFRYIYSLSPNEDGKHLTQLHKDDITYVIERFDMIALFVKYGIVDEKLAIEAYCGVTILKCWYKLKWYIDEVRKHQGMQWGIYAENFARHSLEYYKGFTEKWITYYRNIEDEPIDLVKILSSDENICPKFLHD